MRRVTTTIAAKVKTDEKYIYIAIETISGVSPSAKCLCIELRAGETAYPLQLGKTVRLPDEWSGLSSYGAYDVIRLRRIPFEMRCNGNSPHTYATQHGAASTTAIALTLRETMKQQKTEKKKSQHGIKMGKHKSYFGNALTQ